MTDLPKWIDMGLPYEVAMHGMQAGVAFEMNYPDRVAATAPKHLRVGINAAMSNHGALVALLIKKGVITSEEYFEEMRLAMNDELARYEQAAKQRIGKDISFR